MMDVWELETKSNSYQPSSFKFNKYEQVALQDITCETCVELV